MPAPSSRVSLMPKGVYPHRHLVKKVYPDDLVDAVRRIYGSGASQIEVAQALGLTLKVVYRVMANHQIPRRPQIKRDQRGEKNSTWKGGAAGYQAFHIRVRVERGAPTSCGRCGTANPAKKYEWANLTGRYEDTADYQPMCLSCHRRYDNARRREGVVR